MRGLNGGQVNIASCSLGGATEALVNTVQYLKDRKAFQSNLADFQVCRYYQFVQQTSVAKETTIYMCIYIYIYISVAVLAVQGSRHADRADCLSTDGAQGCCRS